MSSPRPSRRLKGLAVLALSLAVMLAAPAAAIATGGVGNDHHIATSGGGGQGNKD